MYSIYIYIIFILYIIYNIYYAVFLSGINSLTEYSLPSLHLRTNFQSKAIISNGYLLSYLWHKATSLERPRSIKGINNDLLA